MYNAITRPRSNFNGGSVEPPLVDVRSWMNNNIPYLYMDVIIYTKFWADFARF